MSTFTPQQLQDRWPGQGITGLPRANWWLRLTSSGWDKLQVTIEQRELVRRSQLTSWIILGLTVMLVVLVPTGFQDPATLAAVGVAFAGTLIAAVLNRFGWVTVAGSLLVLLVIGGVMGALAGASDAAIHAGAGTLTMIYIPAYDLLAIAVVLGASILPRGAAFIVAAVNIALIITDFNLQPKAGELLLWLQLEGPAGLIARPIGLQIIVATVAFLWVRGTDQAIRRADRAEEVAAIEHQLAEQKRQLDVGIRQILETHVRVANGDFSARAPLTQDNVLFQIAASLNNLLNRLGRAAQSEHFYQRTVAEIGRLRDSLLAARSGRPALWPAPSGTPVDALIEVIAGPARQGPSAPFPQVGSASGPRVGPEFQSPSMPFPGAAPLPQDWRPSGTGEWDAPHPQPGGPEPRPGGGWDMPPLPDRFPPQDPNARG